MVLGPGAGNFDYRISGSWNGPSRETVSIHLWGGGNATSTDQSY